MTTVAHPEKHDHGHHEASSKTFTVAAADQGLAQLTQAVPVRFTELFINGEFVPSKSGKRLDVFSPQTGAKIASVAEADEADVDIAVKAARDAYENVWRHTSCYERQNLMLKLADLMEAHLDELAALDSIDNGKPFMYAKGFDATESMKTVRFYAGFATKIVGQTIAMEGPYTAQTRHEPIGVCGQIIPWNFPLLMLIWKIAPCLACGNTLVLKSSEKTPLSALLFAELTRQAGFPAGVVNILSGYGPTAGKAIACHMDVDKLAFTGSGPVGRKLLEYAAQSNLKKVTLELGGKSPAIIFPDCDLDAAINGMVMGIFFNAGQVCCAGSRAYCHESIYDEFVTKLASVAKSMQLASQANHGNSMQPIVDDLQHKRVMSYIDIAKKEGAKVSAGGESGDKTYVQPTVFSDVTDEMRIGKEEVFGPVLSVLKFSTIEEVIQRANKSEYGLAASIWTQDVIKAQYVSSQIRAGTVWINSHNVLSHVAPFGGFKQSGIGRDLGSYALSEYSQVKSIISSAPLNSASIKIDVRK